MRKDQQYSNHLNASEYLVTVYHTQSMGEGAAALEVRSVSICWRVSLMHIGSCTHAVDRADLMCVRRSKFRPTVSFTQLITKQQKVGSTTSLSQDAVRAPCVL